MRNNEEIIDVEILDEYWGQIPNDFLIGRKVRWHNGGVYPIVALNDGSIGIKFKCYCQYCNKRYSIVYLGSGLHAGAFCYAYNKHGKYLANLRDQSYVCGNEECKQKQSEVNEYSRKYKEEIEKKL